MDLESRGIVLSVLQKAGFLMMCSHIFVKLLSNCEFIVQDKMNSLNDLFCMKWCEVQKKKLSVAFET